MLLIHAGGPAIGAVEVPSCFSPTDDFLEAAALGNMSVLMVNEDELKDGLEGLFLAQGQALVDAIRRLATDPSLN